MSRKFTNIITDEDRKKIKELNIQKNLKKVKGNLGGVEELDRLSFYPAGSSPSESKNLT